MAIIVTWFNILFQEKNIKLSNFENYSLIRIYDKEIVL